MAKKKRITIDLSEPAVKVLKLAAKADRRLLKNYLEKRLNEIADGIKEKNESK